MDNTNPPPEVPPSFLNEKVLKLNSILESLNQKTPTPYSRVVCKKENDSDVMLIKLVKDDEYPNNDEFNEDSNLGEENFEGDHLKNFQLGVSLYTTRHIHVERAYIDLDSPLNIKSRCCYNWIMTNRLAPRKNPKNPSRLNNFIGKPFVELCGMTYDSSLGVVRLTKGKEDIAYKMPHKIEQYDSLLDDEKENMKSVYLRNEDDKRKGVEYVMSKILGFYKGCLELGPEYQTGQEESSSGTSEDQGGVT
ncbi:hypothetical protein Tco_1180235 [Tanacetum coccineum]